MELSILSLIVPNMKQNLNLEARLVFEKSNYISKQWIRRRVSVKQFLVHLFFLLDDKLIVRKLKTIYAKLNLARCKIIF